MVHTWKAMIYLFDEGETPGSERTSAHVVLTTTSGTLLRSTGTARRRPGDADVPEIGEELAVSRALRRLADDLLAATAADITEIEHHPVTLAA